MPPSAAKVPPGLEVLARLHAVLAVASPAARGLLSTATAGLLGRGWLQRPESLVAATAHNLDLDEAAIAAELPWLTESGLLDVQGDRVVSVACLFSARPTGLTLTIAGRHPVDLLGPLAALAVTAALEARGEIRVRNTAGALPFHLTCDEMGVHAREPDTLALFLPSLPGGASSVAAMAAGQFFADDEALAQWQTDHGDPPGMPVPSMLFGMAAADLGAPLGRALAPVLSHLPDFD